MSDTPVGCWLTTFSGSDTGKPYVDGRNHIVNTEHFSGSEILQVFSSQTEFTNSGNKQSVIGAPHNG